MLFLMGLTELVGQDVTNTSVKKCTQVMCSGHDDGHTRNKSGRLVREHLKTWEMEWIVCEVRHDLNAPAKCRPGGSGFQTE